MAESFQYSDILFKSPKTQEKIYTTVYEKVSEGIKKKSPKVKLFDVLDDTSNNHMFYTVELKPNKYKENLLSALEYFRGEEVENYEMCQKCKDLIDKL